MGVPPGLQRHWSLVTVCRAAKLCPLLVHPAGRYTQIRVSPVDGLPTIVWNGDGLRFSLCVNPVRDSWSAPVTLPVDPDPRFIRIKFARGLPVLVYAAVNNTELHVTSCADQAWRAATHAGRRPAG